MCVIRDVLFNLVRDGDAVLHYRIQRSDEGRFFIARRAKFRTLRELVEHYTQDADGLCVILRKPCIRASAFMLLFPFCTLSLFLPFKMF